MIYLYFLNKLMNEFGRFGILSHDRGDDFGDAGNVEVLCTIRGLFPEDSDCDE